MLVDKEDNLHTCANATEQIGIVALAVGRPFMNSWIDRIMKSAIKVIFFNTYLFWVVPNASFS